MAQEHQSDTSDTELVDDAVAQGGAYEVIRKRLLAQGELLQTQTSSLNEARLAEFGSSDMQVLGRTRVRTENNCVARDIVQVGQHLLFGYNVFIGLKKETSIEDVLALFELKQESDTLELVAVPSTGTFLSQAGFVNDFGELYRYYKHARLVELTVKQGMLLAGFQIGERLEDMRVFRWSISPDGSDIHYIDNRGERDIQLPPSYDFEWVETSRENFVNGRHPHINILDTVFVETVGGDLTIKIENNTEDGLGIYSEDVEDGTQSLDDSQVSYAAIGTLILLKIRPYQEEAWRYFVYNTMTQSVLRIDAIGDSCVQLPEDHGIIFPGGYYLQSAEFKSFGEDIPKLGFKRTIRSPNGEDVLYVFYDVISGTVGLFAYNMIRKELANPILCHGYALADDGRLVIFSAEDESTRVHSMQIWQTPYTSDEFASRSSVGQSFYGKIGNAELVRGISDLYSVARLIDNQSVSAQLYEELSRCSRKLFDDHYWLEEVENLSAQIREISETSELVIDEFEKVRAIREQSARAMREAEQHQKSLLQSLTHESWDKAEQFVDALGELRRHRGHLLTIREYRYIDLDRLQELGEELERAETGLGERTVAFMSEEKSLQPYLDKMAALNLEVQSAEKLIDLKPLVKNMENTASGLDLLSELMGSLQVEDATVRTRIIDSISQVYALINQSRANAGHKQKSLGSEEAIAQFSAQFKLFGQSIANALGMSTTPNKCDEQLARLLVQLEELESQFSDYDHFLSDIMDKREEIYESFESHKQQLLDERQRKAQSLGDATTRILSSIEKRSLKFVEVDELNAYFASDTLVLKVTSLCKQLRELESAVKADDLEARFKSIKEQALRSLRDKTDIFEEDGAVIKLGPRHRFSVNTQELDLTIIPREDYLNLHLTGTDYYETVDHPELMALSDYWQMSLESESSSVYRSEYLASLILEGANNEPGTSGAALQEALLADEQLEQLVRDFANPRYREGYEKGVHDHDAALILKQLIPALDRADLLRYGPLSRGLAQVIWADINSSRNQSGQSRDQRTSLSHETWQERAQSAAQMRSVFASNQALNLLADEVHAALTVFLNAHPIPASELEVRRAAEYLVDELSRDHLEFIGSKYATDLVEALKRNLDDPTWRHFQTSLEKMTGWPAARWNLSTAWLNALISDQQLTHLASYIPEAVALINVDGRLDRRPTEVDLELQVEGLLGEHPTIREQTLGLSVDTFLEKMERHRLDVLPGYRRYLQVRQDLIQQRRGELRLEEYKAKPLSSFVRNRLINESYLPLIGDNLAKQMGTAGDTKRTDLMGLLMMISPPGYGKTTLMEYVANRLGLIFMKINCPSLGHSVMSLDPEQAPNATAASELIKLNLALEMGSNVMLYLDDIQHTHSEFLQKFISLCDGTRRIEGVWQGATKTYDMRGKKFCVVMAGNPYTESGESFKVPDMLANRADIYNLGDILSGMDEQFALSYIENSITSNPVLAPLAAREMDDIYKLISMAKGSSTASTDLSHSYSNAEINEITDVLKKMFVVQDIVLKINKQYIASAAQDDRYRTEPTFKLQGSYRNMNKMTEKISSVMNKAELMQMIADHYLGEAQLLTTGAEANLLKLAELRGNMDETQSNRWQQITRDFLRNKAMGGDDAEVGGKVVAQLADLVSGVQALATLANSPQEHDRDAILGIAERITQAIQENKTVVNVVNEPVPGINKILNVLADSLEHSIMPLVRNMDKKLDIDLRTHEKISEVARQLQSIRLDNDNESDPIPEE